MDRGKTPHGWRILDDQRLMRRLTRLEEHAFPAQRPDSRGVGGTAASAMAKVVFLDIDGVCHQVDDPRGPFRPKCMMQLKKLVHSSGAEICLSSSWRESEWGREKVDKYLTAHDMGRIASTHITPMPEEGYNTRGDEILAW